MSEKNGSPKYTNKLALLNQVVARLDNYVIFIAEDGGDLVGNPPFDQVDVDFLDVDLPVELGREFGRHEALLVDTERHGGKRWWSRVAREQVRAMVRGRDVES